MATSPLLPTLSRGTETKEKSCNANSTRQFVARRSRSWRWPPSRSRRRRPQAARRRSRSGIRCAVAIRGRSTPGPFKASLSVSVKAGTVLRFTNNDVMPHKLIQTAGPKVRLVHPNMLKMASSATVKLTQKGLYRFTTKAGEDYAWAASMKTVGEDNVLRLTVRVK